MTPFSSGIFVLVLESPRAAIIILLMREVVTENLERMLGEDKLKLVVIAFRYLMEADKEEKHFMIRLCNKNDGRGEEVWCIVDEYPEEEGGRTATYLLPHDY